MRNGLGIVLGLALAAGATAWDAAIAPAPAKGGGAPPYDGARMLSWDNGTPYWMVSWYTGENMWVGNDFTMPTGGNFRWVRKVMVYAGPVWPNGVWDGWYLALFTATNGQPGAIIGTKTYVKGTSATPAWNTFIIDRALPAGTTSFCAGIEQIYNFSNSDAFILDSNPTYRRHSWFFYNQRWFEMTTDADPYKNLMLRVVVDNESYPGIEPASLGRVRTIYY